MNIKIDMRETKLIEICKTIITDPNIIIVEALPIGDIIIESINPKKELLIIERKSISDLLSSIKDGRYDEQSYRLTNYGDVHNHNIVYLIEGKVNFASEKIVNSAMFSLQYYKGFSVVKTNSIQETASYICNCFRKIDKEKEKREPYYLPLIKGVVKESKDKEEKDEDNDEEKEKKEKEYCSVVKKVKKDNITPNNISEIMLCQLPGISSTIALIIMKEFGTLYELIRRVKEDSECLKTVTYLNAKNQTKKLNKTVIENIIKYFNPA
jgi:ERCC4-type nuclease